MSFLVGLLFLPSESVIQTLAIFSLLASVLPAVVILSPLAPWINVKNQAAVPVRRVPARITCIGPARRAGAKGSKGVMRAPAACRCQGRHAQRFVWLTQSCACRLSLGARRVQARSWGAARVW